MYLFSKTINNTLTELVLKNAFGKVHANGVMVIHVCMQNAVLWLSTRREQYIRSPAVYSDAGNGVVVDLDKESGKTAAKLVKQGCGICFIREFIKQRDATYWFEGKMFRLSHLFIFESPPRRTFWWGARKNSRNISLEVTVYNTTQCHVMSGKCHVSVGCWVRKMIFLLPNIDNQNDIVVNL